MRGTDTKQASMLSLLTPEKRVPEKHPLRLVKAMVEAFISSIHFMTEARSISEIRIRANRGFTWRSSRDLSSSAFRLVRDALNSSNNSDVFIWERRQAARDARLHIHEQLLRQRFGRLFGQPHALRAVRFAIFDEVPRVVPRSPTNDRTHIGIPMVYRALPRR